MSKCHICHREVLDGCCQGIMEDHNGVFACPQQAGHIKIRDWLESWPIPERYAAARLGQAPTEQLERVHTLMHEAFKKRQNVFLCGQIAGNGKTHAAYALLRHAIDLFIPAIMADTVHLMRTIKEKIGSKDGISWIISDLSEVDILIVDDLGKQAATAFSNETLWDILNERYNQRRMTVITSNLHPNEFNSMAEPWPKLMSRLSEDAKMIELTGESLRGRARA